jgi:hypothetical protein
VGVRHDVRLSTLLHTVPSAIILVAALHYAGGVDAVWHSVAAQGNGLLTVARPDAAIGFGITLALGLLTATIAGQEFWQVAWALKKKDLSRTFLWAGAWFYPIPICLGLLGLIGLALPVEVNSQLGGDAAAVGPFLVSHLGLPTWLVILYVIVILSACIPSSTAPSPPEIENGDDHPNGEGCGCQRGNEEIAHGASLSVGLQSAGLFRRRDDSRVPHLAQSREIVAAIAGEADGYGNDGADRQDRERAPEIARGRPDRHADRNGENP